MSSGETIKSSLCDTISQRLLSSSINDYISFDQSATPGPEPGESEGHYVIIIRFSKLIDEMITKGCSLSFTNIYQRFEENYYTTSRNDKRSYLTIHLNNNSPSSDALCLNITPETLVEEINTVLSLLIQYIQENVIDFTNTKDIINHNNIKLKTQFKRVLITGSAGWLGQFVFQYLLYQNNKHNHFEWVVYGTYHNQIPHWIIPSHRFLLDLTNRDNTYSIIEKIQPDIIIHLAAISSPMKCYQTPELALKINCPTYLVSAVQQICPACLFVFASTDMVYDGNLPPYKVEAINNSDSATTINNNNCNDSNSAKLPQPVNVYGEFKLAFEQLLITASASCSTTETNHKINTGCTTSYPPCIPPTLTSPQVSSLRNVVILRLSNMMGAPYVYTSAGEKFLQFLYNAYKKSPRTYLGLKHDEIRSFVCVQDVVEIICTLMHAHVRKQMMSNNNNNNNNNNSNHVGATTESDCNIEQKRQRIEDTTSSSSPSSSSSSSSSFSSPLRHIDIDSDNNSKLNDNNTYPNNLNPAVTITKILNVGGPVGLSRLQVAEILCQSQGSVLDVVGTSSDDKQSESSSDGGNNMDDNNSNIDKWKVYVLGSVATPTLATNNTTNASTSNTANNVVDDEKREFQSPRDITMINRETESYINNILHNLSQHTHSDNYNNSSSIATNIENAQRISTTTTDSTTNVSNISRDDEKTFHFHLLNEYIQDCLSVQI